MQQITGPDTTPHNVEKREDMKRDNRAVLTQTGEVFFFFNLINMWVPALLTASLLGHLVTIIEYSVTRPFLIYSNSNMVERLRENKTKQKKNIHPSTLM